MQGVNSYGGNNSGSQKFLGLKKKGFEIQEERQLSCKQNQTKSGLVFQWNGADYMDPFIATVLYEGQ